MKLHFILLLFFFVLMSTLIFSVMALSGGSPLQPVEKPAPQIAFFTPRLHPISENRGLANLVILNPVTREERMWSLETGVSEPTHLAWSPDYRKLAMSYIPGPRYGSFYSLATFDVTDGTIQMLATTHQYEIVAGRFSSAGTELLFLESTISGSGQVAILNTLALINTGLQPQRISENNLYIYGASWSSVGRRLAISGFYSNRQSRKNAFGAEIFLFDLSRYRLVNVTNSQFQEYFASWSPDGAAFAYISDETGKQELYVMETTGHNKRRISQTEDPLQVAFARWLPDGKRLIYLTRRYTYSNNRNTPWKPMQFILHDLDTGQQQMLIERNWVGEFDVSPNSDQLAYVTSEIDLGPSKLCVLDINTLDEWCTTHGSVPAGAVAWGID